MTHGHHHPGPDDVSVSGAIDPSAGLAPNPGWLILRSVGIDVGSTTSHLTFSKLFLERQGIELSSRFQVVRREVLYRTPILLTPYADSETIDTERLAKFVQESYRDAGLRPPEVDTGAVICTGEAVKKRNSEAITRMLSAMGGNFVCATAGPHLEGILSAHGSGAVARSIKGKTVLNVDVGGGTSKLTLVRRGAVLKTAAINIGARLLAWDLQGRLERIDRAGLRVARHLGVHPELGSGLSDRDKRRLARALADLLFELLRRGELSPLAADLLLTDPFVFEEPVDEVAFSGGVAEYVYGSDRRDYGDLGPLLAEEILSRLPGLGVPLGEGDEKIRATVIGASQYTVQVSSSTIFISDPGVLPLRDCQVVVPRLDREHLSAEGIGRAITAAIERLDIAEESPDRPVAVFFHWPFDFSYDLAMGLASGITSALDPVARHSPWVLAFDSDIGGLLGYLLKQELGVKADVVIVDEIDLCDLDFIDIGMELRNRGAVPVVVKSLMFG